MNCTFCKKLLNPKGFSHIKFCKENPNRIIKDRTGKNNPKFGKPATNQFLNADKLNINKPVVTKETRDKISAAGKNRTSTIETRQKLSISMKLAVKKYPESYSSSNVNGRTKKITYKDTILDSSWELIVAKWLDLNEIDWTNKVTGFEYEWNGTRIYYPDFFLPKLNLYIEVKGYQRERDIEKWKSVRNLVVLKQLEIKKIINGESCLDMLTIKI